VWPDRRGEIFHLICHELALDAFAYWYRGIHCIELGTEKVEIDVELNFAP